jgi:hypothetical protein
MPGPFEPPGGQEPEPPDVRQAVLVVLLLLGDLHQHLTEHPEDDNDRAALLLRMGAVVAVLRRIRDRLEE